MQENIIEYFVSFSLFNLADYKFSSPGRFLWDEGKDGTIYLTISWEVSIEHWMLLDIFQHKSVLYLASTC